MKNYKAGDTILIEATIYQKKAFEEFKLFDPRRVEIEITKPDNSKIRKQMDRKGKGLYFFNYQTNENDVKGVYKIKIITFDGYYNNAYEERKFKIV